MTTDSAVQMLLIRLGNRDFGIEMEHVRQIAPLPLGFPYRGNDVPEHIVFEDSPHSYVSLWDRLRIDSAYREYEDVRAMLPQRRQDHIDWIAALGDSIRNGVPFSKARDPHGCAFGKWFYAFHPHDRRLQMQLRHFEAPHARIHALADHLLDMTAAGEQEAALKALADAERSVLSELLTLFDETAQLLSDLERHVTIIVGAGDDTCALGADGIRDIVLVPEDRIKRHADELHKQRSPAVSALVILENDCVVPLLDWRSLRAH